MIDYFTNLEEFKIEDICHVIYQLQKQNILTLNNKDCYALGDTICNILNDYYEDFEEDEE